MDNNDFNSFKESIEAENLAITGGELVIEATIDGKNYSSTIWVDSDLTDDDVEKIKTTVIEGFKKVHLENQGKEQVETQEIVL